MATDPQRGCSALLGLLQWVKSPLVAPIGHYSYWLEAALAPLGGPVGHCRHLLEPPPALLTPVAGGGGRGPAVPGTAVQCHTNVLLCCWDQAKTAQGLSASPTSRCQAEPSPPPASPAPWLCEVLLQPLM